MSLLVLKIQTTNYFVPYIGASEIKTSLSGLRSARGTRGLSTTTRVTTTLLLRTNADRKNTTRFRSEIPADGENTDD